MPDVYPLDKETGLPIVGVPPDLKSKYQHLGQCVIMYFEVVKKLNQFSFHQNRVLVISDDTLYLAEPKGDVKRCVPICGLTEVVYDSKGNVGLVCPYDYDVVFKSTHVEELLTVLAILFKHTNESELKCTKVPDNEKLAKFVDIRRPPEWQLAFVEPTNLTQYEQRIGMPIDNLPKGPKPIRRELFDKSPDKPNAAAAAASETSKPAPPAETKAKAPTATETKAAEQKKAAQQQQQAAAPAAQPVATPPPTTTTTTTPPTTTSSTKAQASEQTSDSTAASAATASTEAQAAAASADKAAGVAQSQAASSNTSNTTTASTTAAAPTQSDAGVGSPAANNATEPAANASSAPSNDQSADDDQDSDTEANTAVVASPPPAQPTAQPTASTGSAAPAAANSSAPPASPPHKGGVAAQPVAKPAEVVGGGASSGSFVPAANKPNFNTPSLMSTGNVSDEGKCHGCGEAFQSGRKVIALGQRWHPECFKCGACSQPFKGQPFVQRDGKAFHKQCMEAQKAVDSVRCPKCNEPITGKALLVKDVKWHEQCFVCMECSKPFEAGFVRLGERPFHKDCAKEVQRREKEAAKK